MEHSILSNLQSLFRKKPGYFTHIEGLRALGALRVMLTHLALFAAFYYPLEQYLSMVKNPLFKMIFIPGVLLDSFFVISGLVIGYSLMKKHKDQQKISLYDFFVRRAARILPLYGVTIIIAFPFYFNNASTLWANLLLVNNYITIPRQYAAWTWALAVEIQFYILFGLIMGLVSKRIIGKKICTALAIGFFLMPFILIPIIIQQHYYPHLQPLSFVLNHPESWLYFDIGFDKLYIRSGPIFYGLMSAYLLVYHKDQLHSFLERLSPLTANLISLLSIATLYFVLSNDAVHFLSESQQSWQTSAYWNLLFQHHLLSLALCVLILLAPIPKGIIMKTLVKVLNSVFLRPLGRLSFTTYMIHPVVFFTGYAIYFANHPAVSVSMYIQRGLWLILITYLLAIPCYLAVELPAMANIKQRFLKPRKEDLSLSTVDA